jgi:hypothetical protein
MFEEESDKIGEGSLKAVFLSLCVILIFSSISILVSLILDISKQLLIGEILTRIILSIGFFGFGFGSLKFWRMKNKVNNEEEYWETLRQISNDYHDIE